MAELAIGALLGGSVSAGTVLGAVAEVGLATTVVGAVTGNKNMMKVGGTMSLIGGVGGMVAGAFEGAAGAAAEGAAGGAAESGAADAALSSSLNEGVGSVMDATGSLGTGMEGAAFGATAGMSDAVSSAAGYGAGNAFEAGFQGTNALTDAANSGLLGQEMGNGVATTSAVDMGDTFQQTAQQQASQAAQAAQASQASSDANTISQGVSQALNNSNAPYASTPYDTSIAKSAQLNQDALGVTKQSSSDFLSKIGSIGDWMDKHKTLTYAGMQIAGSMMSSAQRQQEADRAYDLKRRELALQEQNQFNRSHTAPVPYRPIASSMGTR